MNKETLIKLAQPAATTLLAISVISIPLVSHAFDGFIYGTINVNHNNSCAN
jgi:hypothetical protein